MSQKRTGPSRRTAAERAAIDARADAYPRPVSATQIRALKILAAGTAHFVRSVAGWHRPGDSLNAFSTQTITSLRQRRFVKRWRTVIVITAAGRDEARRHR